MTQKIDTGTSQLICELKDHVATVKLNRPEKRNALGDIITPALRSILLDLDTNDEVRVVVLTGAGSAFCSGGDVAGMKSKNDEAPPKIDDVIRKLQCRQQTLTLRLHELSKPTIASIPGAAAGAGMSIALACDLRISAKSGFLTTGFAKIGLSGDYGGSWTLNQIVGPAITKELYFTGRRVYAEEALQLGLVNKVVEDSNLETTTLELATTIAKGPPLAIRYMKENINRAVVNELRTCLDWEADRLVRCARTNDHKEGVTAFLQKRLPDFRGN